MSRIVVGLVYEGRVAKKKRKPPGCCASVILYRKSHLLSADFACDVVIEEITVNGCLDGSGHPDNRVPISLLCRQSIQPVEEIKGSITAQCEHVMRCEVLYETTRLFGVLLNHEQLRHNSDSFEPK